VYSLGYGPDKRGIVVRLKGAVRFLFRLEALQSGSKAHSASLPGPLSARSEQPVRDYSPPSSAKSKNAVSFTSIPTHTRLHGVYRDNFAFKSKQFLSLSSDMCRATVFTLICNCTV